MLAAARASALDGPLGGSTTSGTSSGGAVHGIVISGAGRAVLAGAPWRAAAVAGAVMILLAGLATVWRGPRWPVMSSRFERAQGGSQGGSARGVRGGGSPPGAGGSGGSSPRDSAAMWESLSRDVDPTVDGGTRS